MASEQGAVSVAPANSNLLEPATAPTTTTVSVQDSDPSRTKSLKRSRPEQSQNSGNLSSIAHVGLGASPSPKSPRFKGAFSPAFAPIPLTGAAALADERRQREENQKNHTPAMSENPAHKALSSLVAGGGAAISKPQDGPNSTAAMSAGLKAAANVISIPSPKPSDEKPETSPASVTSLASLGTSAQTATASPTIVASPSAMTGIESESRDTGPGVSAQLQPPVEHSSHRSAMSYPGNVLTPSDAQRLPPRGLSLPMPGQNQAIAPRSPSQKKHKCPYCETEFTRHHNLKSHLLTHSQEKPYVCQTCTMRFRRLHDLKRHMKLHTGERPHICPKCDRKFARGDALARHAKGQGGCAGRRASMGSFGGDDDYEGSQAGDGEDNGMDGVMYTNGTPQANPEEMTEEERRRYSLPAIKAQKPSQSSQDNYGSRTPSTYPPAGPRPGSNNAQPSGGLYPPGAERGAGSSSSGTLSPSLRNSTAGGHTPGGSLSSIGLSTGGNSLFSQSGMTESPKPLSPAGMISHQLGHDPSHMNRQRSPSLTTQFQQQHFGRRQSGRSSPTGMSLPSPHSQGPKLPAIAGLAPPDQRYTLTSQTPGQPNTSNGGPTTSPSTMYQPPMGSGRPTNPPHQQGSGVGSNNLFADGDRGVWAYVQSLEDKVKQMADQLTTLENEKKSHREQVIQQQDQINRLSQEVFSLRGQQSSQSQALQAPVSGHS
jgi:hypothetical protein